MKTTTAPPSADPATSTEQGKLMDANIQTKASADSAKIIADYVREATGLNADVELAGLNYTNTFIQQLNATITVKLTEEQAAELNERLGL